MNYAKSDTESRISELGHRDDLSRVEQLLRDVDQGFWSFCTSYNSRLPILPHSNDKLAEHFLYLTHLCGLEGSRIGG